MSVTVGMRCVSWQMCIRDSNSILHNNDTIARIQKDQEQAEETCRHLEERIAQERGAIEALIRQACLLYTSQICAHARITVEHREATAVPKQGVTVIAAGPLASDALAGEIEMCIRDRFRINKRDTQETFTLTEVTYHGSYQRCDDDAQEKE